MSLKVLSIPCCLLALCLSSAGVIFFFLCSCLVCLVLLETCEWEAFPSCFLFLSGRNMQFEANKQGKASLLLELSAGNPCSQSAPLSSIIAGYQSKRKAQCAVIPDVMDLK